MFCPISTFPVKTLTAAILANVQPGPNRFRNFLAPASPATARFLRRDSRCQRRADGHENGNASADRLEKIAPLQFKMVNGSLAHLIPFKFHLRLRRRPKPP